MNYIARLASWFLRLPQPRQRIVAVAVMCLAVVPIAVGGLWIVSKLDKGARAPREPERAQLDAQPTPEFSILAVVRASGCSVSEASAETFANITWPTPPDAITVVADRDSVRVEARSNPNGEMTIVGGPCPDRVAMEKILTSSALWERYVTSRTTCESGSSCERLLDFWNLLVPSDKADETWDRYEKAKQKMRDMKRGTRSDLTPNRPGFVDYGNAEYNRRMQDRVDRQDERAMRQMENDARFRSRVNEYNFRHGVR